MQTLIFELYAATKPDVLDREAHQESDFTQLPAWGES